MSVFRVPAAHQASDRALLDTRTFSGNMIIYVLVYTFHWKISFSDVNEKLDCIV